MEDILNAYFEKSQDVFLKPLTNGLINSTYEVYQGNNRFILQKINTTIFKKPEVLISNSLLVSNHLRNKNYSKGIITIIPNRNGNFLSYINGETWRLTNYIPNSICYDQVISDDQAFAAAEAISEFHALLNDLPIEKIQPSIEGFLDYKKRVEDYQLALKKADPNRLDAAREVLDYINANLYLVDRYLAIQFPYRIVHADAKISNFLFAEINPNQVTAVIDWDTFIPGNILCDFGDMVRTYASLKAEDDASEGAIFSKDYYDAVKKGFLAQLQPILSPEELEAIDLTAYVVILIQAIRFVTDYLQNDIYYHIDRENHNLDRTINQVNLLRALQEELCIN